MTPRVVNIRHGQRWSAASSTATNRTPLGGSFLSPVFRQTVAAKWPRRPNPDILSHAIPLFFIARNRHGLWVAREADGRIGGMFIFRRSAHHFANKQAGVGGCATTQLSDIFELDTENGGNPCATVMAAVKTKMAAIRGFFPRCRVRLCRTYFPHYLYGIYEIAPRFVSNSYADVRTFRTRKQNHSAMRLLRWLAF
jgi:hypothetical protein